MNTFPEEIEEIILKRVRAHFGSRDASYLDSKHLKKLSYKVKELSDYFTKRQADRPQIYFSDKELIVAYVAYFLPSNILKITRPLEELYRHSAPVFSDCGEINILDLGCGPGTASAGLLYFLSSHQVFEKKVSLKIRAIDSSRDILREAKGIINSVYDSYKESLLKHNIVHVNVETLQADINNYGGNPSSKQKYDMIIISNALCELGTDVPGMVNSLGSISSDLKTDGSMIIIEPALRDSSRRLLELRDHVLRSGEMNVYSPCLTQDSCRALVNKKDWCHEADQWRAPAIVRDLDRLTGFEKTRLNYSYMVLRKDGLALSDVMVEKKGEVFRVVSDLLVMKGDKRIYLCGKGGRIEVGRLDRERSDSNSFFDDLKRGDIVEIEGLYKKGALFRVGKEGSVTLLERG